MNTLHLVDPELQPLLEAWPTVTLDAETLKVMRARQMPLPPVPETGVDLERVALSDAVTLHVYTPREAAAPTGCIYHIHGGGYVGGGASELEFFLRPLADTLGCAIVSVDYRLAPETPHPGPVEDCYAGLAWTFAQAARLGIDPARIGVMGESAGGGLAAALALLARDRGDYALAFQHLTYPMIDDRTCTRDPHPTAGEFIWHAANNRFGWAALLGHEPGIDGVSPYAAAARADDLTGLPPTYIMTGALDLFVDEDIAYARRLIAAGVATELHVHPGAFHGFDIFPAAAVAQRAQANRIDALRRALA
ncbi:arylesterase [Sphingomonas sp. Leaf412]|uniref:alpha/beta hydrolase n=1 Tax=Sphingomonas sp. Leaf412 TaxID=1736370 RepID=UPI0006F8D886|nr:alpha/beta hydrolase fold domain-containing protein [Sphingomonas sp. Leaf412]KQT31329.1 arylesterase [Sphingomonas sp. Leaf412]